MPAIKLAGFGGIAPKISPELLPDQGAQTAANCKLYSGDLIPYPQVVVSEAAPITGNIKTIYPLRNPTTNDPVWLAWTTEVNVTAPSSSDIENEQRFYYTGDGVPKVSTYALATSGSPRPFDYYQLGLPLPSTKPTVSAAVYSAKTISTIARDAGNTATYVTSTAHALKTGMSVAITGFSHFTCAYSRSGTTNTVTLNNHGIANGSSVTLTKTSGTMTDGVYTTFNATTNTFDVTDPESGATSGNLKLDVTNFNTIQSVVTVISPTSFSIFAPGFQLATYSVTGATVDLSGSKGLRKYLYTWFTPWLEESIGSDPSADLVAREGQVITVSNLPTTRPSVPAKNFIEGIRLYRTVPGTETTDYFLLKTLWFPQNTATVSRTTNVSTVTTGKPHNLIEDDKFKLTNCTTTSFNITDGVVIEVVDRYTFKYNQAGSDVATSADTTGILYHNAAETEEDTTRYWGDTDYTFTDDFNALNLVDTLESSEYEAPDEDMVGLKVIQNNVLCGFVGKELHFSEVDNFHAWPTKYRKKVDFDIVAIEPISGVGAIVLTEGYPYLVSGTDPTIISLSRIDVLYPCASSRGVVPTNYGIVWPTFEGLASYTVGSAQLATGSLFSQDQWQTDYDPSNIVATYYGDAYFGSNTAGSFVYTRNDQGGVFTTCSQVLSAVYNDPTTGRIYFTSGSDGIIYEWDNLSLPNQTMTWKSKVYKHQNYLNYGAARVIADYVAASPEWEDVAIDWEDENIDWGGSDGVTFKLFSDKQLVFTKTLMDSNVFRLPTGYRTDTYEVSVDSDVRVRAIHLGETPLSLKAV